MSINQIPVIRLANVDIYQQRHLVLSNINTTINKGEFVYLIGQTGSGKSSLLKVLYGDLEITTGDAAVAGFDLQNITEDQIPFLRRKLGIVFQDFQLLTDRNVKDNLDFAMRATGWNDNEAIERKCIEVLEKVGLRNKLYNMPHELSGGEQQRIVIARALVNDPEIIIADEPTGNLDPITSEEITALLKKISESGTSVLMSTHDYYIIQCFPSRILKCENGMVIETNDFI